MKISRPRGNRGDLHRRGRSLAGVVCSGLLAAQLACVPPAAANDGNAGSAAPSDVLLKTMQAELQRAQTGLAKADPKPYYIGYTVYDQKYVVLAGAYGSLLSDQEASRRQADVTMRVGSSTLDNTHGQSRMSGITSGAMPLVDDPDAIARVLWELTDREYKRAAPAYLNVRTNTAVRAEEEDKSPDFSKEAPEIHVVNEGPAPAFDRAAWESEVRRLSANFRKYPEVYFATVVLQVTNSDSRMVSSEGSAIETPSATTRLIMEAQTRA